MYTKFAIPTLPEAFSPSSDRHLEGSKMLQSHSSSKGQNQPILILALFQDVILLWRPKFSLGGNLFLIPSRGPLLDRHADARQDSSLSLSVCRSHTLKCPVDARYYRNLGRYMPPQGVAGYDAATSQWERIGGPPSISRTHTTFLPLVIAHSQSCFNPFAFLVGCGQLTTVAYYYTVDRHERL